MYRGNVSTHISVFSSFQLSKNGDDLKFGDGVWIL